MKGLDEHDGHPLARRAFKSARPAVCVCPARGSYGTGGVVRVVGTLMEPAHAAVPRQEIAGSRQASRFRPAARSLFPASIVTSQRTHFVEALLHLSQSLTRKAFCRILQNHIGCYTGWRSG